MRPPLASSESAVRGFDRSSPLIRHGFRLSRRVTAERWPSPWFQNAAPCARKRAAFESFAGLRRRDSCHPHFATGATRAHGQQLRIKLRHDATAHSRHATARASRVKLPDFPAQAFSFRATRQPGNRCLQLLAVGRNDMFQCERLRMLWLHGRKVPRQSRNRESPR
jgi:hypothetical protein